MDSKNVANMSGAIKKTKGRKKIEIKKINNESNLRVTFSKRRSGVFKKASELATLCGVDIAVIMFSPGNRVFSFGSPDVDSVIQRYTAQGPPPVLTQDLNEAHCTTDEGELHAQLNCLSHQIAMEKKREKDLNSLLKETQDHFWWASPIETMNKAQLQNYKKMMEDLKTRTNEKRHKIFFQNASTHNPSTHEFFAGGTSSSSNVSDTLTALPPSCGSDD
ncbi:hypothetical protein VNO78_21178 [Psophocarpus tetragonolobus]|uniref:MADS-box domain-containing protein n=1 Tax=Psophocarpus tetragonolobus TaxID=3891 RepID=A0AAN9SB70_PSOTE